MIISSQKEVVLSYCSTKSKTLQSINWARYRVLSRKFTKATNDGFCTKDFLSPFSRQMVHSMIVYYYEYLYIFLQSEVMQELTMISVFSWEFWELRLYQSVNNCL